MEVTVKNTTAERVYLPIFQPETPPNALNAFVPASSTVDLIADGNATILQIAKSTILKDLIGDGTLVLVISGTALSAAHSPIALSVIASSLGTIRSPETGEIHFTEQDGVTGANLSAAEYNALTGHLIFRSPTNDFNIFLNSSGDGELSSSEETLQITRGMGTDECRFTSSGGTGSFKFMNDVELTGSSIAPTPSSGDSSTLIATTAFVTDAVALENSLAEMEDVSISSLTDDDVLLYDSTSSKWENKSPDDIPISASVQSQIDLKSPIDSPAFTGNVGIGTSSPDPDSVCTVYGEGVANSNSVLAVTDSSSQAEGVGGGIQLRGIYDVAGNSTIFGSITAKKDNGNATEYGASLQLGTRTNGTGDVDVGFTVNSDQTCSTAGDLAVNGDLDCANITATDKIIAEKFEAEGHLKLYSGGTNDCIWYLNSTEACQMTLSGSDVRWTATGGSGTFKFNQETDLADGMKLGGIAITSDAGEINLLDGVTATTTEINYLSGVSSAIQDQIDSTVSATAVNTLAISSNDSDISSLNSSVSTNTLNIAALDTAKAPLASPHFTGNVGIGTSSPDGDTVFTVHGEGKYGTNGVMSIEDSTSVEAGNGGGIALKGIRDVAGNQTVYGGIRAQKDNATAGQYGASVEIVSRANGSGDPEVGFTVNSDQTCTTAGALTAGDAVALTDTSDPSAVSGFSHIYSKSGEAYVQDQSGNVTKISPHDSESGDWEFYSVNKKRNSVVRVNMMDLIRTVEELSGTKLIFDE